MAIQDVDPQYYCDTQRYAELARLAAYFDGSQYDLRPDLRDWTDDSVPMRDRRPTIVYPLPKAAVNQVVSFAVGEGKFPALKAEIEEEPPHPSLAMSEDDAEAITASIADLVQTSRLASTVRDLMRRGCSARSACAIVSLREGLFSFELPHAKDCIPTFRNGDPSRGVDRLVWAYQFEDVEADEKGKPRSVRRFFRRDIDGESIVDYEPAEVRTGQPVEWRVSSVAPHGFGECPVVWTRNLSSGCDSIDGVSIYDGLLDEVDALNRSLSQRHHGLEILGVPQPYETGVADGDGPRPAGRSAIAKPQDKRAPSAEDFGYRSPKPATSSARKAGAAYMWSYGGEGVGLGLLETTGKAFEVASAHVADIRSRLLEAMNVILLDPTEVAGKGDMSAKALSLMYAPMLALVDEMREHWWAHCVRPLVEMMLRIAALLGPGAVLMRGGDKAQSILSRRNVVLVDGESRWFPPRITPLWGEYFGPSAEESKATVEAAAQAKEKGLVSAATATRYVANLFGVANVDEEVEAIEEEKAAALEEQAQVMAEADPNAEKPTGEAPGETEEPEAEDE